MAKLGDICTVVSGSTPKTGVAEYWDGTVKWITPAELNEDSFYITDSVRHITEYGKEKTGLSYLPKGTVILSSRAPIGKTAIAGCEMCCNQGFKNLICSDAVYNEYLYFFLKSKTDYLNSLGRGATFKEISKSIVEKIEIPLPNIEKQHQIVKELKATRNLIAHRKQQLTKLDELVKARFVEMFGNFVYELDRWSTCEIGDVADTIDPQPSHRTPPVSLDGIPYIGIAECNYQTRKIAFKSARKVGKDVLKEHKNRYTLNDGDFIIGKIGTIGKPFFLPTDCDYTLSANTVLIKPQKDKISPRFLFAIFESEYMDRIIDAEKKSTSQPAFGIQKVRSIEIPLPPLSLQNQFADFAAEVDKSKLFVGSAAAHKPFDIGFFSQKHCATPCKRGIISSKHMIFH